MRGLGDEGASGREGFSLIEMLVVLTLLAVMAAVVAPALISLDAPPPATSADEVVHLFTDARRTAVTEAREVELHLDFQSGHYRLDEQALPPIAGTLRAAGSLRSGNGGEVGTWRFRTDGRVEGPELFVTARRPRTIRFDPGTGELLP